MVLLEKRYLFETLNEPLTLTYYSSEETFVETGNAPLTKKDNS